MKRIIVDYCDENSIDVTMYVSELDDFIDY